MDDTPICLKLCGGSARFVFLAVITFYVGGVGSVTVMHFGRLLTTNNLWDNTNNQSTRLLEMNKRSHSCIKFSDPSEEIIQIKAKSCKNKRTLTCIACKNQNSQALQSKSRCDTAQLLFLSHLEVLNTFHSKFLSTSDFQSAEGC